MPKLVLAGLLVSCSACQLIFDSDELIVDGEPDELADLPPGDFTVSPMQLFEGAGSGTGRPQPLVLTFNAPVPDSAELALQWPDVTVTCGGDCSGDASSCGPCSLPVWSSDRRSAALLIRVPVIESLSAGDNRVMTVLVETGDVSLAAPVLIVGLDELVIDTPTMSLATDSLAPIYSRIEILADTHFTGTSAAILKATGPVFIDAEVSVSAEGQLPGPGGGAGGLNEGNRDGVDPLFGVPCIGGAPIPTASAGCGGQGGGHGGGGGNGEDGVNGYFDDYGASGLGGNRRAGDSRLLSRLFGGGGGGAGDDFDGDDGGDGGGGGGALLISSATELRLSASALLSARGGGGSDISFDGGIGAGGGGGSIILRSPSLVSQGVVDLGGGVAGADIGGSGNGGHGLLRVDGSTPLTPLRGIGVPGLVFESLSLVQVTSIEGSLSQPLGASLSLSVSGTTVDSYIATTASRDFSISRGESQVAEVCIEFTGESASREEARHCASVALLSP